MEALSFHQNRKAEWLKASRDAAGSSELALSGRMNVAEEVVGKGFFSAWLTSPGDPLAKGPWGS